MLTLLLIAVILAVAMYATWLIERWESEELRKRRRK